jgi:hypothetical protein
MTLEENLAAWVKEDNSQQEHLNTLKGIRERKAALQDVISREFESRGMTNPVVRITDGRLAMAEKRTTQSLTLGLVKEALEACIPDSVTVETLMTRIRAARSVTHQIELRRYYSKPT